ncbi:hypothetical protein DDE19_16615 [Micromonospora ureilytica]|uniref:Ig-like domain-containing protein n=1 Tax=Micromonospora ureilytica TaxID=709868 RepID=A0A3N9Y7W5_9ACTN|nr:hypothetical protein [Micromonospora ureilytica]RQX16093.1 hypothetical protein DDE19_16615 [Micromonospora ureilytica]
MVRTLWQRGIVVAVASFLGVGASLVTVQPAQAACSWTISTPVKSSGKAVTTGTTAGCSASSGWETQLYVWNGVSWELLNYVSFSGNRSRSTSHTCSGTASSTFKGAIYNAATGASKTSTTTLACGA